MLLSTSAQIHQLFPFKIRFQIPPIKKKKNSKNKCKLRKYRTSNPHKTDGSDGVWCTVCTIAGHSIFSLQFSINRAMRECAVDAVFSIDALLGKRKTEAHFPVINMAIFLNDLPIFAESWVLVGTIGWNNQLWHNIKFWLLNEWIIHKLSPQKWLHKLGLVFVVKALWTFCFYRLIDHRILVTSIFVWTNRKRKKQTTKQGWKIQRNLLYQNIAFDRRCLMKLAQILAHSFKFNGFMEENHQFSSYCRKTLWT